MNSVLVSYVLVALGGALGAMSRLFVGRCVNTSGYTAFPWHTLFINVMGSFLLGAFVAFMTVRSPAHTSALNHLVAIGFLGAFTTFSTFELETWNMFVTGNWLQATGYVVASVVVAFCGLALGIWVGHYVGHTFA